MLGVPLAWVLARVEFPGRRLVRALVTVPLVLPPVVGGVALLLVLGRHGLSGAGSTARSASPCRSPPPASCSPRRSSPCRSWSSAVEGALRGRRRPLRGGRGHPRRRPAGRRSAGSRCRWSRPASRPARCCAGPGRSASSAPRSPSPATSPARTQTMPLAVYLALETDPEAAIVLSLVLLRRRRWRSLVGAARPLADAPRRRRAASLLDARARRRPGRASGSTCDAARSPPARWSRCSARTAPARPPRCGRWPACCRSTAGTSPLDGDDLDDRRPARLVPHRAPADRRGLPGLPALPAPQRPGQRRVRPAPPRRRPADGPRARRRAWLDRVGLAELGAAQAAAALRRPGAAGGAGPGAGRRARGCCCSTSRSPRSTPAPGWTSAPSCAGTWPTYAGRDGAGHPRPAGRDGAGRPAGRRRGRPGRAGGHAGRGHRAARAPTTSPGWSGCNLYRGRADGHAVRRRRRS